MPRKTQNLKQKIKGSKISSQILLLVTIIGAIWLGLGILIKIDFSQPIYKSETSKVKNSKQTSISSASPEINSNLSQAHLMTVYLTSEDDKDIADDESYIFPSINASLTHPEKYVLYTRQGYLNGYYEYEHYWIDFPSSGHPFFEVEIHNTNKNVVNWWQQNQSNYELVPIPTGFLDENELAILDKITFKVETNSITIQGLPALDVIITPNPNDLYNEKQFFRLIKQDQTSKLVILKYTEGESSGVSQNTALRVLASFRFL